MGRMRDETRNCRLHCFFSNLLFWPFKPSAKKINGEGKGPDGVDVVTGLTLTKPPSSPRSPLWNQSMPHFVSTSTPAFSARTATREATATARTRQQTGAIPEAIGVPNGNHKRQLCKGNVSVYQRRLESLLHRALTFAVYVYQYTLIV